MSGRRAFRSLICAGCGRGYTGNQARDMLNRHCRERHPELRGRVTRRGLEGPVPVDAVPSPAVGSCNLQCDEVLSEDLRDLELGPESKDLMFAPQVSLPLVQCLYPLKFWVQLCLMLRPSFTGRWQKCISERWRGFLVF